MEKEYSKWQDIRCIELQQDIGVHIHSSLKVAAQMETVVENACSILFFFGHDVEYKPV